MEILTPKEMSKKLGVTVQALQRWDESGTLKAYRTSTNQKYYTEDQYFECVTPLYMTNSFSGLKYDREKWNQMIKALMSIKFDKQEK